MKVHMSRSQKSFREEGFVVAVAVADNNYFKVK